jgi:hypothetical protein
MNNMAWRAAIADTSLGGGPVYGAGFGDFIKSAGNFLRKVKPFTVADKVLNETGLGARLLGNPYGAAVLGTIKTGKSLGYGRKRRKRGGSLVRVQRRAFGSKRGGNYMGIDGGRKRRRSRK